MRAIDADALKEKAFGKRGGLIHTADIDEMPTIEERKTGKWIDAKYPFSKCNVCGSYFDTANNVGDYCPNCGSRMER